MVNVLYVWAAEPFEFYTNKGCIINCCLHQDPCLSFLHSACSNNGFCTKLMGITCPRKLQITHICILLGAWPKQYPLKLTAFIKIQHLTQILRKWGLFLHVALCSHIDLCETEHSGRSITCRMFDLLKFSWENLVASLVRKIFCWLYFGNFAFCSLNRTCISLCFKVDNWWYSESSSVGRLYGS